MMVSDCLHLRVPLFLQVLLREAAALALVHLACRGGVDGKQGRQLTDVAATAGRAGAFHGLTRLRGQHQLLESMRAPLTFVLVDRHAC